MDIFEGILLMVMGGFCIFMATKPYRVPGYALEYARTHTKAWIWRKIFGVEKTAHLIKTVFAPIGICLGIAFIVLGILSLTTNFSIGLFN